VAELLADKGRKVDEVDEIGNVVDVALLPF
jgi:hypothetical protein